jgi:hypothetical protein
MADISPANYSHCMGRRKMTRNNGGERVPRPGSDKTRPNECNETVNEQLELEEPTICEMKLETEMRH